MLYVPSLYVYIFTFFKINLVRYYCLFDLFLTIEEHIYIFFLTIKIKILGCDPTVEDN